MFKYIVGQYKSIKTEYMNRTPKGKWHFVLNMAIFALNISGSDVISTNFKLGWYSYISGVVLVDCVLSFIYTLWYYADDPLKGLLFIATFGVFVPVFKKRDSSIYISNLNYVSFYSL